MADNVYLLETRLSVLQQAALSAVREVARQHAVTVFLVGGAVRDLISGSPVRDLDVAIQGNALDLRSDLEAVGGSFSGEDPELQALYLRFPGGVRIEVGSTLSATYPKPGQPVYQPTSILEDLRRRDFTANAMALSLNDGSYGLLMDPLNGVADIENRELRLVSNYGFIDDPVRMIRSARLMARLGWQMDERTRARYETGKEENYISAMRPGTRAYELEELFHEEDPLRVMRRLEDEGLLGHLSPALGVAKANIAELGRLREVQMQFQTRGVVADGSSANFALLTAKLTPREIDEIRKSFPRFGFVEEIEALESSAKELTSKLLSKELATPSAAFRYLMSAPATTVVYAAYSSRSTALQNRLKSFLTEWPTAQTKIPYVLMQEMRIVPELPEYGSIVEKVTYALMDGKLESVEEMRSFLEPFSPPAPPPPVSLRRPRAPRKEAKAKGKKKVAIAASAEEQPTDDLAAATAPVDEAESDGDTSVAPIASSAMPAAATKGSAREADKPTSKPARVKKSTGDVKPEASAGNAVQPVAAKPVVGKPAAVQTAATRPAAEAKKADVAPAKKQAAAVAADKSRPASARPVKTSAKAVTAPAKAGQRASAKPAAKTSRAPVPAKAVKAVGKPKAAPASKSAKGKVPLPKSKKAAPAKAVTKAAGKKVPPAKRPVSKPVPRSAKKAPAKKKK